MYMDARTISADEIIETDVCIVGAGPAGITLAREFINQKFQVYLVESGGFELDLETQSLCDGKVVGDQYPPLVDTRRRQFGGTSHCWEAQTGYKIPGFRCLPLDAIDFEQRDWLPHSGWPFTKAHLDPFYERAQSVCNLGPFSYDVDEWVSDRTPQLRFNSDRLITKISQYAPRTPFTHEYPNEIKQASNISVLLHANVINIEANETLNLVTRVQIACLHGNRFWIRAKVFILAAGGIENARLLLLSNQQQSVGLGNQHDLVGRYFMERPIISCGQIKPFKRQLFDLTHLYDIHNAKGIPIMAFIQLNDSLLRCEHLMNNGAQLFPKPWPEQTQAGRSLKKIIKSLLAAKFSTGLLKELPLVMKGSNYLVSAAFWAGVRRLPGLQRGAWSYLPYEKRRFSNFEVIYQIEQAPDPNNRVLLGSELDLLGLAKAEIHWQLNPIDINTIKRVQEIWKQEFLNSGIGDLELADDGRNFKYEKLAIHHHMGTTRMHVDPRQGVVDENGLVHSLANLFITGSSVFPTAGYANPTLTIIALAVRLSDHIKNMFAK